MEQPIELTSPKAVPNNKLLTLAWKVMAQADVRKFTLRLGTEPGKWDIFNGELSKNVKEMTLPPVTGNPAKLFAELGYTVPEHQGAAQPHTPHHEEHEENILHGEEPIEIALV